MIRVTGLLLLVLTGIACSTPEVASTDETMPPQPDAVVVLGEYSYSPAVLSLNNPELVEVQNLGGLAHTWTVLAKPIDAETELVGAEVLAEARVGVGQSATADIAAIPPGRYQVVCAIPGHFSAGMEGELVVDGG